MNVYALVAGTILMAFYMALVAVGDIIAGAWGVLTCQLAYLAVLLVTLRRMYRS